MWTPEFKQPRGFVWIEFSACRELRNEGGNFPFNFFLVDYENFLRTYARTHGFRLTYFNWRDALFALPPGISFSKSAFLTAFKQQVGTHHYSSRRFNLAKQFSFGFGDDYLTAFLNLKLAKSNHTARSWRQEITSLRTDLRIAAQQFGITWDHILTWSRDRSRPTSNLRYPISKSNIRNASARYGELLSLANFIYPGPDTGPTARMNNPQWNTNFGFLRFLTSATEPSFSLYIDVKQAGSISRKSQDDWLHRGGSFDQVPAVEQVTAEFIQRQLRSCLNFLLTHPLVQLVEYYVLGDDMYLNLRWASQAPPNRTRLIAEISNEHNVHVRELQVPSIQPLKRPAYA